MSSKRGESKLRLQIAEAQKDKDNLVVERFKLLLQIEEQLKISEILDKKIEAAKAKNSEVATEKKDCDKEKDITFFVKRLTSKTTEDDIREYFQ